MTEPGAARLERSCGPSPGDWLRIDRARPGLERMEAYFGGHAFGPHRHDTYAIGYTLRGVQSFGYRGTTAHSLAGQAFVLHPDETHDGHAGTEAGFRYRILYVDPSLIRDALGDPRRPLPFQRDPVSADLRLGLAVVAGLGDLEAPLEDLEADQVLTDLAAALSTADPSPTDRRLSAPHVRGARAARQYLDGNLMRPVASDELEAVSGLSRYALARHFRACHGTSPHRYHVLRRLDRVRALIRDDMPLAEAADATGFADQSHMTRHFVKAYGITPAHWRRMTAEPS